MSEYYDKDKKSKYGRIFIEIDGVPTDITDLNKEDYEWFLDKMKALELLYNTLSIGGQKQ